MRQEQDKDGSAHPVEPARRADTVADHEQRLRTAFSQYSGDTLVGRMGIKIIEASAQRAVATMPVAGNTQPYGLLHGGASCVLAETIGSLASALHAGPGRITVGIEINATHHRAASDGLVTGVATMVHGGSTLTTYEIVITDERGRRVCTARLSCLLRDEIPGLGLQSAGATVQSAGAPARSAGAPDQPDQSAGAQDRSASPPGGPARDV